ncbi:receptor-type tyrosine-protein phosphatase kappa-like [Ruditapes philippinarum]|uniref:receptor-type tyrosine-protein phosphatase kappa-like n=1 Tax=Ruditapes philippinarum TaxID=129788 RepID=UPI00295B9824|nr:receptor-type tyrosine-protein phosphatase kappa-like [Ruditapes philippinarum]
MVSFYKDIDNLFAHLVRITYCCEDKFTVLERPSSKADKERKSTLSIPPTTAIDTQPSGNKTRSQVPVTSSSVDIDEVEVDEVEYENKTDDTYYNIRESPYRIKVDNLLKYVTSGKVDFEAEFKKLNKDLDLTKHCSVAKDPQNLALNRYNGIYPYDHSRVTIQDLPDFFINACYIDGYCKEKEYIASLGPTSKTTANFSTFWLMVWYKKTDIVVMLTNLRETSGMKCEQYWPEEDTEIEYGDITVKCRSVEAFAEYTVRTCTIIKGKNERQIIQLHFTAWPDKGVPQEVTSLVEFRQRVNAVPKTLGGPIIVHCSAGVGRTGTYIGLDILTQEGKEKGSVDVFDCVNRMRHQRVNMVQTAEQYKFLHKALVHSLSFGCETLTAEEIQRIMYEADDNTFMKIYKTLALEVDIETEDEINAREENRKRYKDKNRRNSNVPCDSSRVRLFLSRTEGKNDYINAVFINSFRIKNLFIAAQTPLPKTVEDFLSMVFQQHTCCVVALEDQNAPGKDVGQYLPADNETDTFGNFSVTSSKYETKSQYILKQLTVKDNTKDQKKSVFHFQYKNWQTTKKVPDSAMDFVQFIKDVEKCVANDPEDNPNIIAHCLNGFERSGLFCVVYKLLEKLEAERQVSVVNVVRKIRTHRPQSITSMEQLKFCYECVSAYLEIYNTYSNFAS